MNEAGVPDKSPDERLAERALRAARDTRLLRVGSGARRDTAAAFTALFGAARAVVVADPRTFAAAGSDIADSLRAGAIRSDPPILLGGDGTPADVHAHYEFVEELAERLSRTDAIPVAVGSGTINDLVKLAAHQQDRPYLVVATAASMDGYTAYGASITYQGSKQTFACPAPRGVVADLEVIAAAPRGMNASGYADLFAKVAAGGDWMVADALGDEPIVPDIWQTVQSRLRTWLGTPEQIERGEPEALRRLVHGLMLSGFAMQAAQSSRPASGAEHQFSHLWDMQRHPTHHGHHRDGGGAAASHGFQVGIGTLASLALYKYLLAQEVLLPGRDDVERAVRDWPTWEAVLEEIDERFEEEALRTVARREMEAKYVPPAALRAQLLRLREMWPDLRARLARHLYDLADAREALRAAGCPDEPEQIGLSRSHLRASYHQAYYIRRRFTVLDLAVRTGHMEPALDHLFGPDGPWPPM